MAKGTSGNLFTLLNKAGRFSAPLLHRRLRELLLILVFFRLKELGGKQCSACFLFEPWQDYRGVLPGRKVKGCQSK